MTETTVLRVAYLIDAAVTAPIALSALLGSRHLYEALVGERMPSSGSTRTLLGSLWTALLLCLVAGSFRPIAFCPVLVLQLIYKGLWLTLFAIPRWATGRAAEVSWKLAAMFTAYVLIYPWIIPWARLLV